MPPRPTRPPRAGDVLTTVLQRIDPEQQLRAFRVWRVWDEVVGPAIARRSRPTGFRNGILFVTVATHGWMQELQFVKASIRERLNAHLDAPLIRDIYLVSGSVDERRSPGSDPHKQRLRQATMAVPLPPIGDPALSKAFASLVSARARRIARARRDDPG